MDRMIKNYNKIVEALSPLTKQVEMLQKSIAPMTKVVEEIQKPLKVISGNAKTTENLTKGLKSLIRTTDLNNLGIYSKEIGELPEYTGNVGVVFISKSFSFSISSFCAFI